ncbi:MAG TPA: MFS transporter, partial [Vicinamibacteria bacterium]|nr:MFS transporter [Vicinamibacteria bacterium]
FVDRYGTKIGYTVSIAFWSTAAVCHAFVGSVSGFFAARIFLGLSEGGNFPSAIKAVALWFPRKERALATAVFNSGTNVGALLAPLAIPLIAVNLGWRWAFVFAGMAGFLWLLLWIPLYEVPERSRRLGKAEFALIHSDREQAGMSEKPLGSLRALRLRETWSFISGKFLTDPIWWFFLIWLPDYFRRTRGLDIKHSWVHIVTIYGIVTVLGIAGGWFTGHLSSRGWSVTRARKTGMFLFALLVLPILFVTKVGDWEAVLILGLAASAHQAWSANLFTTVSDLFPKKDVGTVVGLGGMAGSIGGMLFPWFSGYILDHFPAADGYAMLFSICAFAYLVSFAVHHVLAPTLEPIPAEKLA